MTDYPKVLCESDGHRIVALADSWKMEQVHIDALGAKAWTTSTIIDRKQPVMDINFNTDNKRMTRMALLALEAFRDGR